VSAGKVWECRTCGGRTVSLYALKWLCDKKAVDGLWKAVIQRQHPGPLPCPVCRQFMFELPVAGEGAAVEVDACRRCHMFWFDALEFEVLPKWRPARPDVLQTLPPEARERLAIEKVKQLREEARRSSDGEMPTEYWQVAAGFMGLPVEHDHPTNIRPVFTWSVAALCLLAVIWGQVVGFHEAALGWGFIPSHPFRNLGLTWLTSFFLHGGWFHLLSNLYFLLIFGDNVEETLKPRRYLLLLLGAALAGDALHWLGDPRGDIPCVGASGGISGIIAYYACRFPHVRLGMMFRYFFYFRWFTFPAWGGFAMWIALQLFITWMQRQGLSNVSALAHLGGAAVGVAFWWWTRKRPQDF
jgi:membrane associated rhomboid family serine protease